MKNLASVLTLSVLALASAAAHADIIATFNSANTVNATPPNPDPTNQNYNPYADQYITPTYGAAGVGTTTVSNFGLGPGIYGTNLYQYGFGFSFSTGGKNTLAASETAGNYIGFTITPTAGFSLDLTDLDFSGGSFYSQDGETDQATRTLELESSVDGFTTQTTLGSISVPANVFTNGVDLTLGSAFSDVTEATEFRLYVVDPDSDFYESVTLKGDDVLTIDGLVTEIPEPGTYALLACGLGGLALMLRRRASLTA